MSHDSDFERNWLHKLAECLQEAVGPDVHDQIMQGSENLTAQSPPDEVISWSRAAMGRLEQLVPDVEARREIMTGCACQYPRAQLEPIRQAYEETRDVDLAHQMLQGQFESFLRNTLQLTDALIQGIVERGWGSAGVKHGQTIVATKIPKSGNLLEYLQTDDPRARRQLYCHCPRVRDALKTDESLPRTYCYCGAGFYKGIWEEILQQPVQVEVLESVLSGGEVCTIAIHLPECG